MTKQIRLKITGMHCASCAILIKNELEGQGGIESADVDYKKGQAVVDLDTDSIPPENAAKVVSDLGYNVKLEDENGKN